MDIPNLHNQYITFINRLFFLQNRKKKPYFWGVSGHIPKIIFFPINPALSVFYP